MGASSAVLETLTEQSCCPQNIRLEEEKRLIQVLGPVKAREEAIRLEKVGMLAEEHRMLCCLANKIAYPAHTCGFAQRFGLCYILIKSRHSCKPICKDDLEMGQGTFLIAVWAGTLAKQAKCYYSPLTLNVFKFYIMWVFLLLGILWFSCITSCQWSSWKIAHHY